MRLGQLWLGGGVRKVGVAGWSRRSWDHGVGVRKVGIRGVRVDRVVVGGWGQGLRGGGVEEVGVGGRLRSGVLGSGGLKSGELK